ncbi:outer membrane beta-barrel protein [Erwiniaceae bacterium BAC15a-03b]|uniref:Outer membrane beta-barrel protein n=1 Tax=Winslowiella arboricola TaxID=2978220 RepID=A0A9J6PJZ6_9GAMM|nr:outer membrane beta-barrel protein [Winslowiella arboricola]MCU5772029.1 outer membrane beta-barrel protein [Winslowiella arboricola]MCU5776101.1 outer membrane beta-barrel protein [Winslowiella arboricola]
MRKTPFILPLVALMVVATSVKAESNHTFSAGYVQSNFLESKGVNAKYLYSNSEFPIGWAGSFTTTSKDYDLGMGAKNNYSYYSVTTGPTVTLADLVTLYALVGVSRGGVKYTWGDYTAKQRLYGFSGGVGAQLHLAKHFVIDAGYERGSLAQKKGYDAKDERIDLNMWTVGLGYSF